MLQSRSNSLRVKLSEALERGARKVIDQVLSVPGRTPPKISWIGVGRGRVTDVASTLFCGRMLVEMRARFRLESRTGEATPVRLSPTSGLETRNSKDQGQRR